jgi:hypothetical protein
VHGAAGNLLYKEPAMDTEQLLQSFLEASPSANALEGSAQQKIFFAAIAQLSGGSLRLPPRSPDTQHVQQLLHQHYGERLQLHEVYGFGLAQDAFKEEAKRHWRTTGHLLTLDGMPLLSVRCHEDGEAVVQVLQAQEVAVLCKMVLQGMLDLMQRHTHQQHQSFNASAFFSDYRRVLPHGGGFFQLHTPRDLDDFHTVTDRYRMYLLGKQGMPTHLSRFLGWSQAHGSLARFASEAGEVEVDACDVLFCAGLQEDHPRLLKLAQRAARPTSWALRPRIHYDPFDASPYSVVIEQALHGHLRVDTTWVYFAQQREALQFCERYRGPQQGLLDALDPETLTALGVTKLEGSALGKLQGVKLAPEPERMSWGKV